MLKGNPLIKASIFICLGLFGAWLALVRQTDEENYRSLDTVIILVGFFMFFFSCSGLLAVMIRSIELPMTKEEGVEWEHDRSRGKRQYIKRFLARWSLPAFTVIAVLGLPGLWNSGFPLNGVVFLAFLLMITTLSLFGIARLFWDHNEHEHTLWAKRHLEEE